MQINGVYYFWGEGVNFMSKRSCSLTKSWLPSLHSQFKCLDLNSLFSRFSSSFSAFNLSTSSFKPLDAILSRTIKGAILLMHFAQSGSPCRNRRSRHSSQHVSLHRSQQLIPGPKLLHSEQNTLSQSPHLWQTCSSTHSEQIFSSHS